MQRISDAEIARIRANTLTTRRLFTKLAAHGALLGDSPLGAGKTHLAKQATAEHLASDHPGLVLYLSGRVDLLEEQPAFHTWMSGTGPYAAEIGALVHRPRELCASVDRNEPWLPLESKSMLVHSLAGKIGAIGANIAGTVGRGAQ